MSSSQWPPQGSGGGISPATIDSSGNLITPGSLQVGVNNSTIDITDGAQISVITDNTPFMTMLTADGNSPYFQFVLAGGTVSAPSATPDNANIGNLVFTGYGTTDYLTQSVPANIGIFATEDWSDTASGSSMLFTVTNNTTLINTGWLLDQDGGWKGQPGTYISNNATQTTLTGSAGTAICSQPEQGPSYKKVMIYLSGYTDTNSHVYTFPTAFSNTPYIYGVTAGVAGATVTTTTVRFTTTTVTGFVFLEGY